MNLRAVAGADGLVFVNLPTALVRDVQRAVEDREAAGDANAGDVQRAHLRVAAALERLLPVLRTVRLPL